MSSSPPADAPVAAPSAHSASLEPILIHLEQLAALATDAGLKTVAAELREERIPTLRSGTLSLVVLGEFNHGKSTLINALLGGRDILPTGITPTTAIITRIAQALSNAEDGQATIHYDDGSTETLGERAALEGRVREENDRVRHIVVRARGELLEIPVELVDTPGVNDISEQKVEVTYGIVPRADVIVFVLDATQVLKRTELRFIEKRLMSGLRERLVFVLGKIDRLDEEEAAEVERYARERLEALLGGAVELFPLSARTALRQPGSEPGFERFREHLLGFLRRQRDLILLDSALATGLRSGTQLLGNLQIKRRSYALDRGELETRVSAVHGRIKESKRAIGQNLTRIDESVQNLTSTARHNLTEFRDAFLAALPREIEKVSAEDVKRYLPGFIESCFRTFLEREGRAIARALEALAEEVIAVTNQNLRETVDALNEELGIDPSRLDVSVDSTPYDFSVFAMGAFGVSVLVFLNALVGGLIALATPVVAYVLRDRLDARLKHKATEVGLEAIRQTAERAETELVQMIDDFGGRLKRFVEDAGDRLYRQIEDALQTVMAEKDRAGADTGALDAAAARIEAQARDIVDTLHAQRERLWSEG